MFCLNYYPFQKYLNDADQLKIVYKPADRTLQDFLEEYKNKSIIIDVRQSFEDIDAKLFQQLYKKYNNIKLIIDFDNKEHINRVQEYKIPYFFANSVTTIDQLNGLLKYNPTDMYICEELGFFLDKVSEILHNNGIKVRVYPNICQSSFPETPSVKTFFIRPQDIHIYSTFVDIFELISDKNRQEIIYKIYKQGRWFGKINELIPTFKNGLDSKYLLNTFGLIRSQCGKRCMYKTGSCNICDRFIDLADTFKDNKIVIRNKKKS